MADGPRKTKKEKRMRDRKNWFKNFKSVDDYTDEEIIELALQYAEEDRKNIDSREYQLTHFAKRADYVAAENAHIDTSQIVKINDIENNGAGASRMTDAWEKMNAAREVIEAEREEERQYEAYCERIEEERKKRKREERAKDKRFWEAFVKVDKETQEEFLKAYREFEIDEVLEMIGEENA